MRTNTPDNTRLTLRVPPSLAMSLDKWISSKPDSAMWTRSAAVRHILTKSLYDDLTKDFRK